MRVRILDAGTLKAVTPPALAAYARGRGWSKAEPYGSHADIYIGEDRPELVLPRTDRLADYASVVSRLIGIFGEVEARDEFAVYADLVGADHDVIHVRAVEADDQGSVPLDEGIAMISQAREMLLAAACATKAEQGTFRAGADCEADNYMKRVRLGQAEPGSFVVRLMAPVPPRLQLAHDESWESIADELFEWQVTRRLAQALAALRDVADQTRSCEGGQALEDAVDEGVSANFCEAVAGLIDQSGGLELSVTWARARPTPQPQTSVLFAEGDAGAIKEAAQTIRAKESQTTMASMADAPTLRCK